MQAPYKLVIADDDDEIRNGLFSYFPWNSLGFDAVYQAEDGKEALDYIQTHPVDVVLCDIRMPRMTGLELARELRSMENQPCVILLSAYQDFSYAQQAISSGVHGYIIKTTRFDELVSIFTELKKELDAKRVSSDDAARGENFSSTIASVCQYIENNYATATLEEASRQVYLSPFHLSRLFRQATGSTFSAHLLKVKMEKAAAFLRSGKQKTYEISSLVGYTNPKNFTRAFKAFYGITPNEYRAGVEPKAKQEEPK